MKAGPSFHEMTCLWFICFDRGMTQNEEIKTRTCSSSPLPPAPTSRLHKPCDSSQCSPLCCVSIKISYHKSTRGSPELLLWNCMFLRGKSSERQSELIWYLTITRYTYTGKLLTPFKRKILKCKRINSCFLMWCTFGRSFVTEGVGCAGGSLLLILYLFIFEGKDWLEGLNITSNRISN